MNCPEWLREAEGVMTDAFCAVAAATPQATKQLRLSLARGEFNQVFGPEGLLSVLAGLEGVESVFAGALGAESFFAACL